jgi:hypothetical protein
MAITLHGVGLSASDLDYSPGRPSCLPTAAVPAARTESRQDRPGATGLARLRAKHARKEAF